MILWVIIIIAGIAADQLTKLIVVNTMTVGQSNVIIDGVLSFTFVRNEGADWGMFADNRWIFIAITAVAIICLPLILYKYRHAPFLFGFSLSLIISGAIGNMIDRVFVGSVVDFIDADIFNLVYTPISGIFGVKNAHFPVFNIADCCVTVGAILMFIYLIFLDKTIFPSEKKPAEETRNDTSDGN